ncbi:HsdM family class I SAM-dependent methyltransferase, partial [Thermococcus sp.]
KMSKIAFVETPREIAELMVELASAPKDGLVLDTGCGRGVFLRALVEKGYRNCIGIELDERLSEESRKACPQCKIINGDYLDYRPHVKFDLIIGNPPYAHFNQLPEEIAEKVRRLIKTKKGDIYYAFIVKSIDLLKPGGELIYIVPYHFFYNTYARVVREKILKNGRLEIVIDLDEVRLFKGENPETVIFRFRKGRYDLSGEKIELVVIRRNATAAEVREGVLRVLKEKASTELFDYTVIEHYGNAEEAWSTLPLPESFEFPSVPLNKLAKVGVGVVSGFDRAFIVSKEELPGFTEEELRLVKRFIKSKNCRRFITEGFEYYIVIPDEIRDEKTLAERYPNIYRKIVRFKDEMERRYLPKNKKWFNWQALRNYGFLVENLNKRRIYVPTLDRKPYNRFSLAEGGYLPSGDVLFIQPFEEKDLYFLLGYLNSGFFRRYYLARGGRRGGRVSFTQRLLEKVEIPLFDEGTRQKISEKAEEIVERLKKGMDASELEDELERVILDAIMMKRFRKGGRRREHTLDEYLNRENFKTALRD